MQELKRKPRVIEIAEWFECVSGDTWSSETPSEAAKELRRLSEINSSLLLAIKVLIDCDFGAGNGGWTEAAELAAQKMREIYESTKDQKC